MGLQWRCMVIGRFPGWGRRRGRMGYIYVSLEVLKNTNLLLARAATIGGSCDSDMTRISPFKAGIAADTIGAGP